MAENNKNDTVTTRTYRLSYRDACDSSDRRSPFSFYGFRCVMPHGDDKHFFSGQLLKLREKKWVGRTANFPPTYHTTRQVRRLPWACLLRASSFGNEHKHRRPIDSDRDDEIKITARGCREASATPQKHKKTTRKQRHTLLHSSTSTPKK